MIFVQDQYFTTETFKALQDYCNNNEFQKVETEGKDFFVLETPKELIPLLQFSGHELVLSFIRMADKNHNTTPSIHADNLINGHKTALASVLYINNEEDVSKNGTAFYSHNYYKRELPENISNEEFDKLLKEDSNDPLKWQIKDIITSVPNRMLTYSSNQFHAKFPSKIERGTRIVLVCFYTKKS